MPNHGTEQSPNTVVTLHGRPQKYKFQIDGVFLWSTGSWDVLAVYPESTTAEGSYFDPVVADIVRAHNTAAQAAGHAFMAPSRAARWGDRHVTCRSVAKSDQIWRSCKGPPCASATSDRIMCLTGFWTSSFTT